MYPEILHVFISVPDASRFSETSVSHQLTRRHLPENLNIHEHLFDCLKCGKSQRCTVTHDVCQYLLCSLYAGTETILYMIS